MDAATAAVLTFANGAVGTVTTSCVLDGKHRAGVEIVADAVQFLGGREDGQGGGGGAQSSGFTSRSDVPVDDRDFQPAGTGARSAPADDDIPF